ncbi:MAG: hypothetical protein ACOYXY_07485 [Thermodesulfobacteriota bacterium]
MIKWRLLAESDSAYRFSRAGILPVLGPIRRPPNLTACPLPGHTLVDRSAADVYQ